jgi:hypothetical protein
LSIEPFAIALVGLTGVGVGAWLNSSFALGRERWHLKRDLYTRLLENLGEATHALDGLLDLEMQPPSLSDGRTQRRDALIARESKAADKIRRATSVAAILLTVEAVMALRSLEAEWTNALAEESLYEVFSQRLASVKQAYRLVLAAAKSDLRWSWHSSREGGVK